MLYFACWHRADGYKCFRSTFCLVIPLNLDFLEYNTFWECTIISFISVLNLNFHYLWYKVCFYGLKHPTWEHVDLQADIPPTHTGDRVVVGRGVNVETIGSSRWRIMILLFATAAGTMNLFLISFLWREQWVSNFNFWKQSQTNTRFLTVATCATSGKGSRNPRCFNEQNKNNGSHVVFMGSKKEISLEREKRWENFSR
jgi:hypothetical protein